MKSTLSRLAHGFLATWSLMLCAAAILLVFILGITSGCKRESKPVIVLRNTDEPSYLGGYISQFSNIVVSGYYSPVDEKKATYLHWKVERFPDTCPIGMCLVDSPRGEPDESHSTGVLLFPPRDSGYSARAVEHVTPEQLQDIRSAMKKVPEWSRISAEQDLNVVNRELYSRPETEWMRPEKQSAVVAAHDSRDIVITFSQQRGSKDYEIKIHFPRHREFEAGISLNNSDYIILDKSGTEHFIDIVDDVLEKRTLVVRENERKARIMKEQEAQSKADAKAADAYLR